MKRGLEEKGVGTRTVHVVDDLSSTSPKTVGVPAEGTIYTRIIFDSV